LQENCNFLINYIAGDTQPPQETQISIPSSSRYVSPPGGHWHCGISSMIW